MFEKVIPTKKSIQLEKKGMVFKIIFGINVQNDIQLSIE
jgi:hypothetical protein